MELECQQQDRQQLTAAGRASYRLAWGTGADRAALTGAIAERLGVLLKEKAAALGVTLSAVDIESTRVDVCVTPPPGVSPRVVAMHLKGMTSRRLRQEFPSLAEGQPTLWAPGYLIDALPRGAGRRRRGRRR